MLQRGVKKRCILTLAVSGSKFSHFPQHKRMDGWLPPLCSRDLRKGYCKDSQGEEKKTYISVAWRCYRGIRSQGWPCPAELVHGSGTERLFRGKCKTRNYGRSHCGRAEMNLNRIHKEASSIPGLAQWVGDPMLL